MSQRQKVTPLSASEWAKMHGKDLSDYISVSYCYNKTTVGEVDTRDPRELLLRTVHEKDIDQLEAIVGFDANYTLLSGDVGEYNGIHVCAYGAGLFRKQKKQKKIKKLKPISSSKSVCETQPQEQSS